ncbi:dehydrogenase [Auricularia subglabra TFB-10046 SS5]|nr:dehydrogenase [Auricularia subglabra TFB-10046 SS5]
MQAVVAERPDKVKVATVPIPVPGPGQVLVKVEGAAQNPVDVYFLKNASQPGYVMGCDFVGTVVELGPEVPQGLRRVGERIAGFVYAGASENVAGAFAEYVVADAAVAISIPSSLSVEEAAGLGICPLTACQLLHQSLGLSLLDLLSSDRPQPQQQYLLVWSGATAVGQYTIQLASLLGLHVVATGSPARHDLLRDLGTRHVIDYADPDAVIRIRELTHGQLRLAVDCFDAPEKVTACIGAEGGTVGLVLPNMKGPASSPVTQSVFYWQAVEHPLAFPALPKHHADGEQYARLIGSLLSQGKLKVVTPHVFPGGLEGVQAGLDYAVAGRVRAEKVTFVL